MPVAVDDLWKIKAHIATAISQATGEYPIRDNVTMESLKETNNEYDISGRYTISYTGKSHTYSVRIDRDGKISFLSIDNQQIIS
ncbi:MAG: hypothetical protein AMDU1_APLC00020G0056 [Thermoplasmatales archaeon A-plasma]|jgi:hypothetical protein|nr:MAG: hypothetical protein AMDU1_APLC00020G0056 [Thermoplasmatales archaeon A-plasma]WMT43999.1 MAG: hypothetical protein RE469_07255 [Cuniculiplasma divulgatum]